MFDVEYNGVRASDLGVMVAQRPNIPAPELKITEIEVAGRDGTLIQNEGTYENIELELEMNYIAKPDRWGEVYRAVKEWLLSTGSRRLKFTDDGAVFYKVKNVVVGENERESKEAGVITPAFLCDPFSYLASGLRECTAAELNRNQYYLSCPIYKIKGEGVCTITVNGRKVTANVGQNLTIDTDLMLAYREDGTLNNAALTGYYEDLRFESGELAISATSGFDVKIIPNWRCL